MIQIKRHNWEIVDKLTEMLALIEYFYCSMNKLWIKEVGF